MAGRVLLPANVKPSVYRVTLEPDLTTFKTKGFELISIDILEPTSTIVLHSKEIEIPSAQVEYEGDNKHHVSSNVSFNKELDTATIHFEHELHKGKATLRIDFVSILNDEMCGFYRSKYFVGEGEQKEERWMGTTQFEATDARRAFPCWDEPAVKAVFEITLIVPENRLALSNMDPKSEERKGGKKIITFERSPIMSTYLVAFVVGEFDYVEGHTKEGVRMRVYTPLGKKENGRFALDVGIKTLSYFTEYFGIPYPLPKEDMIAIADFAAGAMENWGLITYRETALLIDEKISSTTQKQRVAYVVAHELAHQWFGNLVTMEWWSQLWLNEGFATFVGNMATNHLFPEWDIWTLFVNDYLSSALALDGLRSSHPIEVDVQSSAQISEIFDAISYHKGSCVIRMLETYLGEKNFKQGLHNYLKKHEYGNAVTEDLWQSLSDVSGIDVKAFMGTFTLQTGYPVVSIHQSANGSLEVEQTRFLNNGEAEHNSPIWTISLDLRSEAGAKRVTFNKHRDVIALDADFAKSAIKANAGQSGFYRVKYSEDLLKRLLGPLSELKLPPVDRLGIQGDAFALARAGHLPTSQALSIAYSLRNEVDYTVWTSLSTNLDTITGIWKNEPVFPKFQAFRLAQYQAIFHKLGWDAKPNENVLDTLLRSLVLSQLSREDSVVKEAQLRFDNYIKHPDSLANDLRSVVFEIVMLNAKDDKTQNDLKDLYRKASSSEEKNQILRSIAYNDKFVESGLEFTLSGEVRDQDIFMPFRKATSTAHGAQITWEFFKKNFEVFQRRIGANPLFSRLIGICTDSFVDEAKVEEFEAFFREHPVPSAVRVISQSAETVRSRAAWLKRSRDDVAKWLAQF
eukprot:TRINITY_DN2998_c0_g1_i1.p1 TRINITY_DN2998_c0_g1~~TRINITY_DN2998_c0_g1_i1.p1  ORF type:complete len:855 (-),score=219.95 TRINITY_DN2998_c0_g1_i1:139-2703(-)